MTPAHPLPGRSRNSVAEPRPGKAAGAAPTWQATFQFCCTLKRLTDIYPTATFGMTAQHTIAALRPPAGIDPNGRSAFAPGNGPCCPRLWKNASCEVSDAACFPAVRVETPV
jgi:hypothetical protein